MKNNKSPTGSWAYGRFSGEAKFLQGQELMILKILHAKKGKKDHFYPVLKKIVKLNGNGLERYVEQSRKFIELVFRSTAFYNVGRFLEAVRKNLPEDFTINFQEEGEKKK